MSLESINTTLKKIYDLIGQGSFPKIKIRERGTKNIIYDEQVRQYILGDKFKTRSLGSVSQSRSFSQLTWMMTMVKILKETSRTSTQRDIYYMALNPENVPFKDQSESNELILDLECLLRVPRELMNIYPDERALIYGDIKLKFKGSTETIKLESFKDGLPIGPNLTEASFFDCKAKVIYVIEKQAVWTRMIEENTYKRDNALILATKGQAPRNARYLINKLSKQFGLDVYILTDGDPWGLSIANVIIYGSARLAHLRGLAVPDAKWIGVYPSDIPRFKLPSEPLNDRDKRRVQTLLKDPRCQANPWKFELKVFQKNKRKCEVEAGSKYGLTWVVDKYLPEKMKEFQ